MAILVQKFGGTSVGTPERIRAVAAQIARTARDGNQLVIVVSAMGHTTDELLGLAHQVCLDPPAREVDMLLTAGERISMALLSMALKELGIDAVSFTGSQSGIITTGSHRRARIETILGDRVRSALTQGQVAIVAGFQGVSRTKEITTLGRGGSDTTAVALAAVLGASRCDIFTDVDGVFSADPRVVKNARHLKKISLEVMVELALRGAGVLHPRSVELAQKYKVPLWVRNSLKPENEGTEVGEIRREGMEEPQVTGVTADASKVLLELSLARPSVASAVWDLSASRSLLILAPDFQGEKLRMFVEKDAISEWTKGLEELRKDGFVTGIRLDDSQIPVSIVGSRLTQDGRILRDVATWLEALGLNASVGQATSLAITFALPAHRATDAVQKLHEELIEKEQHG